MLAPVAEAEFGAARVIALYREFLAQVRR